MNDAIRKLEPTAMWNNFADLNAVPRPSKKEEKVIEFIKSFGKTLNLSTYVDEVGNVIIKKSATKGMENKVTVVLQSHLDMVHQKNASTNFDFITQGIEMKIEGDWVKANGTTLGADNGIGVASIMALLQSKNIPHPALEALFTIDEETGMTGALYLKGGLLDGKIMLNLDTEEDTELTIGCAGGIDITAKGSYKEIASKNNTGFKIILNGLTGGHSGMDIYKGRANANKLMNRLLYELTKKYGIEIASVDGGSLRNAIPRESVSIFTFESASTNEIKNAIKNYELTLKEEYKTTDPDLKIGIEETEGIKQVFSKEFQENILRSIYACWNGIYRMSADITGLVQTSNNIARVIIREGNFQIQCLTRSSVDSEKTDIQNAIVSAFELSDAEIEISGGYPGWAPKPDSTIVKLMSKIYAACFNHPANVSACHAGLECGILGTNYPNMQMVSFGPNITGAHSPDEKVQISSVQKYWKFLLKTLEEIPENV